MLVRWYFVKDVFPVNLCDFFLDLFGRDARKAGMSDCSLFSNGICQPCFIEISGGIVAEIVSLLCLFIVSVPPWMVFHASVTIQGVSVFILPCNIPLILSIIKPGALFYIFIIVHYKIFMIISTPAPFHAPGLLEHRHFCLIFWYSAIGVLFFFILFLKGIIVLQCIADIDQTCPIFICLSVGVCRGFQQFPDEVRGYVFVPLQDQRRRPGCQTSRCSVPARPAQ